METVETKKVLVTRKIQLRINSDDADFKQECWDHIYSWQRICFKAANLIVSHLYIQEKVKDFYYFTEDARVKLADVKNEELGILVTSRTNTTYRVLSSNFKGNIPTGILSSLNSKLVNLFHKEKDDYWSGKRSLRNYRKEIPMPFAARLIRRIDRSENGTEFCFKLFKIPFSTYLGRDKQKRVLIERVRTGQAKMQSTAFRVEDGKIFLYAAFETEKELTLLDNAVIAEVSLSIEHPVTVKIGEKQYAIGNKEEFLHRRLAIQAARERVSRGARYNQPGKGRKRRMKCLEAYEDKEKKYVEQKLHLYSRMLINLCVKYGAATVLLINQEQKEEIAKEDEFLLRNWSYFSLKEKIQYKANNAGITVLEE